MSNVNTKASHAATASIKNSAGFIRRFTIQRVRLSAVFFGLFIVIESVAQSLGIVKAYPNVVHRAKVVDTLANNSALGLFYGNKNNNIVTASGYMVYRILPILSLIGAIWMVMFINKMLRGQEENGRWELFISGQATAKNATLQSIIGAFVGIVIAFVLTLILMLGIGKNKLLNFPAGGTLLFCLAAVYGAAIALGIGAITSQLAATKRRANFYGILTILGFFILRSIGNVVGSLAWIKSITPFGWIDKLSPFYHSQPVWLIPLSALVLITCGAAIQLVNARDMCESLIADTGTAKPNYRLLGSQFGFDVRANKFVLASWLAIALALSALIAAIDKSVAASLTSSGSISKTFSRLSGNASAHIEIAYLGAVGYLIMTILMIMVTSGVGYIREEEASNRLENFVSGIVTRHNWLTMRVILLLVCSVTITFLSNVVLWVIVESQGIHVKASSLLLGGLSILGPIILLLGLGITLYGLKPRLAVILMYVVVAWSFTIDLISSALKTNTYLADTSLFHYTALVPAANPDWKSFTVLTIMGLLLILFGLRVFQKRDLVLE